MYLGIRRRKTIGQAANKEIDMTADEARSFSEMNQVDIKKREHEEASRLYQLHGPKMLALAHMLIDIAVGHGQKSVELPHFSLSQDVMDMLNNELDKEGYVLVHYVCDTADHYAIRWNKQDS